jgi:hypothetical protein
LGSQEDANDIVLEVCLSFNPQLPLSTQVQTSPGKDMKSPAAYYFIMNMNRSRIDMVKRDDFVQLINAAISQLDRHPRLRGMLDKEFTFGDVIFRVITDNGARGGNKVVAFIPTEVISRAQFTIS